MRGKGGHEMKREMEEWRRQSRGRHDHIIKEEREEGYGKRKQREKKGDREGME